MTVSKGCFRRMKRDFSECQQLTVEACGIGLRLLLRIKHEYKQLSNKKIWNKKFNKIG